MTNRICIYHGNCADGFGAAWAVWKKYGDDCEYYPGVYQNPPPDVLDKEVIMVDFSYKRPVMEGICGAALSVLVLDHHKTAAEDLSGLEDEVGNSIIEFDMERSGAMMAWNYFHPDNIPPQLLKHIQDRDLWKFELPKTREIQAAIFSYPYDFKIWDNLILHTSINDLIREGEAIERKHFKDIDELLNVVTREFMIGGHCVKIANLPYTLTSDAGHKLAQGKPFGGCYWDTPEGRVFSLRSTDDGIDVSEIAKQYGGGGHRNASGFRVEYSHELAK